MIRRGDRAPRRQHGKDGRVNQHSPYWQHRVYVLCPKRHHMAWLGAAYWICSTCHTIYVQTATPHD